jgi:hypothetical protein
MTCRDIGLDVPSDSAEYPLLILLGADRGLRRVRHVDVSNPSRQYAGKASEFRPCAILCLFCAMLTEKWKTHLLSMGEGTVRHQHVIFHSKRDSAHEGALTGQPPGCLLTFMKGWHAGERYGHGGFRWSDAYGELRVTVSHDIDMVLNGDLNSIQLPNTVELFVDHNRIATWEVMGDGFRPFTPVRFRLTSGEHSIVFASRNPAISLPTDPRPLAISVANLVLVSANGRTFCAMPP